MSQATNLSSGVPQTAPFSTSDVAALLKALTTRHSGASRPAVVTAEGEGAWLKKVSGTAWELYHFDGTSDVLIGTINPTAHTWAPANTTAAGRALINSTVTADGGGNVTGVGTLLANCSDLAVGGGDWSNGIKITGTYPTFWAHDNQTNSGFVFAPYEGGWLLVETGGVIGELAISLDKTSGNVGIKKFDQVCALDVNGPVRVKTYTVGTLPAASLGAGMIAYVTDANATTQNSIAAGSGSNKVLVFSDGTNWRIA